MSAERFTLLQALFEQALAVPGAERDAWCAEHCAGDPALREELARLLDSDARIAHRVTARPVPLMSQALEAASDATRLPDARIGRYEVFEEIGRGGMGRVFRAARRDEGPQQSVALKIIRREAFCAATARRFARERQLLAALDHPGIARLIDAGEAADGTPYVAMELVRGEGLLAYCARHALGLRERLLLLRQVLAAVSHAHRHLVVHRDLKPSNVLVDAEGRARLLDFGIAKSLAGDEARTATAERYLTPAYAAPERFEGLETGVACDVYGLGALLYELLSGQPPFDLTRRTAAEAERLVLHTPPLPLDQAARAAGMTWHARLRGDLDAIAQRALRKEPARRYASVEQLDADIERYLTHRPVVAAGSHRGYRLRKWWWRHRLVASFALLALGGTLLALVLVDAQRRVAARERDRAQAALGVLRDAFQGADPLRLAGGDLSARQVLDTAARRVSALPGEQGDLSGEISADIIEVQLALGIAPPQALLDHALAAADRGEPAQAARLRLLHARALIEAHRLPEADAALRVLESRDIHAPEVLTARAHYWIIDKQPERASAAAMAALALLPARGDSLARAEAAWQLAQAQLLAERPDDAWRTLDALLTAQSAALGVDHPRALVTRLRRVSVLLRLARNEEARDQARALIAPVTRRFGHDSSTAALALALHASALSALNLREQALPVFEDAARAYADSLGPRHANTVRMHYNAALMLAGLGTDNARMDQHFETAISDASLARTPTDPMVMYFRSSFADALLARGNRDRALAVLLPDGPAPDPRAMSADNRASFFERLRRAAPADLCARDPRAIDGTDRMKRARLLLCAAPPA